MFKDRKKYQIVSFLNKNDMKIVYLIEMNKG